ncbi:unnamed protein product [Caenorhabditis nigoni]
MDPEHPAVPAKFPNVWKLYPILREILLNMEAPELLNLSLCSKKALKTVSPICAALGQELEINFSFDGTMMMTFSPVFDFHTPSRRVSWQQSEEDSFWKVWVSSQQKIEHIIQLFKSPKTSAKVDLDIDPKTAESMFEWAKQRENRLIHLYYFGRSEEMDVRFLKTFSKCARLSLAVHLGQQFRLDFPLESPSLVLYMVLWVTVEDIWNFKGHTLSIYHSSLRNEELNQFLKDWKSGSRKLHQNVHLTMSSEQFDIPTIVLDIPHVARRWIRSSDQQETMLYEVINDDKTVIASMFLEDMVFKQVIIRFEDSDNRH